MSISINFLRFNSAVMSQLNYTGSLRVTSNNSLEISYLKS